LISLDLSVPDLLEQRSQRKAGATARDWLQYTDDAARLLYLEIDYLNEAKNARMFATSLPKGLDVVVPKVFDNATTARMLTMEYVQVPLSRPRRLPRRLPRRWPLIASEIASEIASDCLGDCLGDCL
jgi:predicted unusual protein kinase regulating ubiquinone biosynthesis (AarF/ABC1/UbiB family)